MARHEAMEEPAVPVGPFHHRGDTKPAGPTESLFMRLIKHFLVLAAASCCTVFGPF
jgi:hypothetical protein